MPTSDSTTQDQEFVGYGPAAAYLSLQANTLNSYVSHGIGPEPASYRVEGQYRRPVFLRSELDRWRAERPGRGARTDLAVAE